MDELPEPSTLVKNQWPTIGIAILITTLVTGSLTYLLTKKSSDQTVNQLQSQINDLKAKPSNNTPVSTAPPKAVNPSTVADKAAFDGCGPPNKYASQIWFPVFDSKLSQLQSTNEFLALKASNLADICQSLDNQTVIAIFPGNYGVPSRIFRYTVSNQQLVEASYDYKGVKLLAASSNFGKRQGDIIPLVGLTGDAGCSATMYYDYHISVNKLELKRSYQECTDGAAGAASPGTWTNY